MSNVMKPSYFFRKARVSSMQLGIQTKFEISVWNLSVFLSENSSIS